MKSIWIAAIFGIIVFSSCDHEYGYTYEVTNQADEEISVILFSKFVDSTYIIQSNETQILFITSHGFEGPDGPYFADVNQDLDSMNVNKNDTLISKVNYLDNSSWYYNEGLYKTTISDQEFE